MHAKDLMSEEVISVSPDTEVVAIAKLMVERGVSAVPVIDSAGVVVGIVSEGDLMGRSGFDRQARRDWWLTSVAEGRPIDPSSGPLHHAGDVMSRHVVTVHEDTDATEIAHLLAEHRIKRVPVVRGGKVVGIVSRGDLLREIATHSAAHGAARPGLLGRAFIEWDESYSQGLRKRGK
jgi:CBS domain-containing protein